MGILDLDNKQMLENCNFSKTILMLIIVLGHSCDLWADNWFPASPAVYSSDIIAFVANWVSSFHVPAFILFSGYIFYYMKYEKCDYQKFMIFVVKKLRRLLIPYFFVVFIWVIPIEGVFERFSYQDIFTRYILASSPNQLWFLWMLFDIFVFMWLFSDLLKKYYQFGILISVLGYIAWYFGSAYYSNIFGIWSACKYFLFFNIGFLLRQYGVGILGKITPPIWILGDIGILMIQQVFIMWGGVIAELALLGLNIFGAIGAFIVLQDIAHHINWKDSRIIENLSKCSMPIYLFHQQIIYFVIIFLNGRVNPYINVGLNFLIAVSASFIISTILMKWKLTRFLIGEK